MGTSTFISGSIPYFDGTKFTEDANLFYNPSLGGLITSGIHVINDVEIEGHSVIQFNMGSGNNTGLGGTDIAGQLIISGGSRNVNLDINNASAIENRFVNFPDKDGTFALLEGSATSTIKIGDIKSCIVMADSDGSGVGYVTMNDGVLTATTTQPSNCQ